ncbi:unnamed protein product [Musa hybrid cultivar]
MMACFGYLRKKKKSSSPKRNTTPGEAAVSVPASTGSISPCKSAVSASPRRGIPDLYQEKAHNLRVFELDELSSATNEFNRMLKIGQGGFGSVYKGFIKPPDGKGERMAVAIKKLNQKGLQGHKQWLTEVQFLGVVDHPNLVKLIGYCSVDDERGIHRLLAYEFMPNKTLEDHLFNRSYPVLSWKRRLQISLGAAEGLAYLHKGFEEVQVIYRDFKASNILLDKEFKPKLSDFGLAREGPTAGRTHVTTAVVGTHGYAAPEYIETGHLTIKSDVWSFGVVMYEILTGRRSLEVNRPKSEQRLLDWVRQFPPDTRKFSMIMDPRLRNEYPLEAACEIAKLANSCLTKNAKARPSMSEVVETLRRATQITAKGS